MSDHVQSLFFNTHDQLRCHYLLWPQPASRSCCLLLHGFTNDAHIWDALARRLQATHNVIAVDFRGHGDSDWDPHTRYTHQQLSADILTLMGQQDFDQWHVIGHSLGARVAMLMLADHADLAASLTIIDTGPEVRAVGVNKVRKDAQNTPTTFADHQAFLRFLSGIYLFAEPARLQQMARHGLRRDGHGQWISKTDPAFTTALWKPADQQPDNLKGLRYPMQEQLWQALAALPCPCLVIRGQASAILSRQVAEKMAFEVIRKAQLVVISRAGHAVMVDNAEEFEAAVLDFLSSMD